MFHSMFMSKPASVPVKDEWAEVNAALASFKAFADNPFEEFPNGEFPVPGVNYFPHLYVADCYGG